MGDVEYRRSRPEDRAAILGLLAEGKPAAIVQARAVDFDWQHGGQNPHTDGRPPFWVATVDGEVVGANGMMPVHVRLEGEPALGVWSCDTIVSPAHRGKGIGKALLERVSAEADVVLGYGISNMSNPILEKLGWESSTELRGLFHHVHEHGALGLVRNARTALDKLTHAGLGRRDRLAAVDVTIDEACTFGPEVDALWHESAPTYASVVERDAAYLTWRYARHPRLRYVVYRAHRPHLGGARLAALLIARPDPIESVIADYCGPADCADEKDALVEAAVFDLGHRGTTRIRGESTDGPFLESLRRAGFHETDGRFRFRVGPRGRKAAGWMLMTGDSDNDLVSLGPAAVPSDWGPDPKPFIDDRNEGER